MILLEQKHIAGLKERFTWGAAGLPHLIATGPDSSGKKRFVMVDVTNDDLRFCCIIPDGDKIPWRNYRTDCPVEWMRNIIDPLIATGLASREEVMPQPLFDLEDMELAEIMMDEMKNA